MRQLILVVVLVAASFLGGAFVNGPGLQWVQTKVLRSLGLNNGGEITSVDLKSTASSEARIDGPVSAKPAADATQGSLAPMPSLLTENEASKDDTSDRLSVFQARGKSAASGISRHLIPSPQPLHRRQSKPVHGH